MKKKQIFSIIFFVIGLVALSFGVVFLVLKMTAGPKTQDGEYLVSVDSWTLEGEPGVIWTFTEIGKGKLTTNNHINDYDFIWSLEDGLLKIETDWLYTLNNEYEYKIENGNLVLKKDDSVEIKFVPTSSVNPEITEND